MTDSRNVNPEDGFSAELSDNYRRAYDNRIGFGHRPALILVDFVQAYFNSACELYADVQPALDSALRVREVARESRIPIIYTNVVFHESGMNGGRFFQKALPLHNFVAGNPMGAWADGLEPAADELVISKQYASAFFGTSLASTLTAMSIDTLLITGVTTSGCIRATCVDSCQHGFIPIVVEEACGDRHPAPHASNLFDMNAKYGDVRSEQDVVAWLAGLGQAKIT
ncbi:MAG: isochorismatase family protein [Chromatocurvus sp.]